MRPCKFKPFALDSEVCDECGNLRDRHDQIETEYAPYREAAWKWMLANGGIWSFYGWYYDGESDRMRAHLEGCGIDWGNTTEPRMESKREFAGTFAEEDSYVEVVIGELFCRCGEIRHQEWSVRDRTLGQIIWEVVNAGAIDDPESASGR